MEAVSATIIEVPTADADTGTSAAIVLSKRQIADLCRFASKDEGRPGQTQVWFQDGVAVATDGHRLTIVGPRAELPSFSVDESRGHGLEAKSLAQFGKSMRTGDTLSVDVADITLTRKNGSTVEVSTIEAGADDAKFPPADKVIPWAAITAADTGKAIAGAPCLNADYLADASRASVISGWSKSDDDSFPRLSIVWTGALEPICFVADQEKSEIRCVALVMPVRP